MNLNSSLLCSTVQIRFKIQTRAQTSKADIAKLKSIYIGEGYIGRWTNAWRYAVCDTNLSLLKPAALRKEFGADFSEDSLSELTSLAIEIISYRFNDLLFDLAVAADISNLGALRFDDGALLTPKKIVRVRSQFNPGESAREETDGFGWPAVEHENLQKVFDWYVGIDGTTKGHTNSPLGRAACAFSYLFDTSVSRKPLLELIWSLIGIEALLGEADQSRRLITDKLLLVLKPHKKNVDEIRKIVREIYDFRSRMLHGNRNIGSKRLEDDQEEEGYRKYVWEEIRATEISTVILSQLLLYCFRRNLREISTHLVIA